MRIRRARAIGCPHLQTGETPTGTWSRTWTESESPSRIENPRPNEQIQNPMPTLDEYMSDFIFHSCNECMED